MIWQGVTAAIAALAGLLAPQRPDALPWLVLVTLFAVPAAAAVHEGAHALATAAVGGRVWRAQLGPVSFENTPTARRISWHWASFAFRAAAEGEQDGDDAVAGGCSRTWPPWPTPPWTKRDGCFRT